MAPWQLACLGTDVPDVLAEVKSLSSLGFFQKFGSSFLSFIFAVPTFLFFFFHVALRLYFIERRTFAA